MIGFQTRYIPQTNHRGARISVQTLNPNPSTGRKDWQIMTWPNTHSDQQSHAKAAATLAGSINGGLPKRVYLWADTEGGYVFVPLFSDRPATELLAMFSNSLEF